MLTNKWYIERDLYMDFFYLISTFQQLVNYIKYINFVCIFLNFIILIVEFLILDCLILTKKTYISAKRKTDFEIFILKIKQN